MDALFAAIGSFWTHLQSQEFQTWAVDSYVKAMRASMFTGFLTLSGFLLSATTFVIIQMKKEVYGEQFYLDRCRKQRKYGKGEPMYAPLRRLSRVLMLAIALSLFASLSQVTVGLYETFTAVVFCYTSGILAMAGVAVVLGLMTKNLRAWFDDLDAAGEKLLAGDQAAASPLPAPTPESQPAEDGSKKA